MDNHGKSAANTCEKTLIYFMINVAFIRKKESERLMLKSEFSVNDDKTKGKRKAQVFFFLFQANRIGLNQAIVCSTFRPIKLWTVM